LKLYGTHQLVGYADDVIIFGGIVHTVERNMDNLVVASKERGLEVNAVNIRKYTIIPRN
jgi:uncharacterized membrane protein YkvA (DUF1232 family)